jgi:prolyl-tRNA editing enzyme YbaK/EbsC (Cys-tRNA(Pro) deacylase)
MSSGLVFVPALSRPHLLAVPVAAALRDLPDAEEVEVAEIDPALADTAAFCERYGVAPAESANCVVIAAKRGGVTPVLVDEAVAKTGSVVIGSGIRGSKLRLPGELLAALPSAQVLPGLGIPVGPLRSPEPENRNKGSPHR